MRNLALHSLWRRWAAQAERLAVRYSKTNPALAERHRRLACVFGALAIRAARGGR